MEPPSHVTRITCPACGAAYEVPASAIPVGGRDVQCSGCGNNWFQLWPPPEMTLFEGGGLASVAGGAAPPPSDAPAPGFTEAPAARFAPGPSMDAILFEEEPELDLPPPKRQIDPEVLAVLRAEAETETEARRREAVQPLESQPELPLPEARSSAAADLRARLARLQDAERSAPQRWTEGGDTPGDPPEPDPAFAPLPKGRSFPPLPPEARPEAPAAGSPRAEPEPASPAHHPAQVPLRPDRSRIAGSAAGHTEPGRLLPARLSPSEVALQEAERMRRGFQIGFALPVVATCLVLGLYLAAPRISQHVPQAGPALDPFITYGDAVQERLSSGILQAFDRLSALQDDS